MSKPKIAFFEFTSCEGCQLTVVDSLQTHPELLEVVDIVQFREAMTEQGEDYQIAFIEGSCVRQRDAERLARIRQQAQIIVALGACAHLAGVNAIRNRQDLKEVTRQVYGDGAGSGQPASAAHVRPDLLDVFPAARPISAVIPVDVVLPGCPIDREEFVRATRHLLQGRQPQIPDYPLCVECKLRENVCLFQRGKTCLGPVIRAGCGAICPTFGDGCEGCRGLISNPNMDSMRAVLAEAGRAVDDLLPGFTMFGTYTLMNRGN
jgi:coenzyme F420-reducing hydrogenase gamma subunit